MIFFIVHLSHDNCVNAPSYLNINFIPFKAVWIFGRSRLWIPSVFICEFVEALLYGIYTAYHLPMSKTVFTKSVRFFGSVYYKVLIAVPNQLVLKCFKMRESLCLSHSFSVAFMNFPHFSSIYSKSFTCTCHAH